MMKRLALTIALAGLSGGAFAADLRGPIIEVPPPLPVPAFTWTGAYAGVNVGLGAGHSNYSYDVNSYNNNNNYNQPSDCGCDTGSWGGYPSTSGYTGSGSGNEKLRQSGVLGGVQVGYNYALAGYGRGGPGFGLSPVIGVEADFDGTGIGSSGALGDFAAGFPYGNGAYVGVGSDIHYFGTVRGRLGFAFDRLLIFGTGGFAYADTSSYVNSPTYGVSAYKNNFHTGIAYGGGFEFALTNNLLLRAEYLRLDLNKKAIVNADNGSATYAIYERPVVDLVRVGLSYKFDVPPVIAPVVARY